MENKNAIIAAVVVVIVIVAAVGIYYGMNNGNDGGDETPTGDKYWFYLDGFSDEINGWHTGTGDNAEDAFITAMDADGITYNISNYGSVTIGEFVGTSAQDPETGDYIGLGTGIYQWTSTDASYFDKTYHYFRQGPVLSDINSNIIYISYGEYRSPANGSETLYYLNPSETKADLVTGGPFDENSGYEPLDYSGEFYFYLDGFSDEINGWYFASGDDAKAAFEAALTSAGIAYSITDYGMITIEDFVGTSSQDPETGDYIGKGTAVYLWTSTDASYFDKTYHYFRQGPALPDAASNIIYISYGEYKSPVNGSETTYYLNPSETAADLITGGPFATA